MKSKYIAAAVGTLMLFSVAFPAQAAPLTEAQISAIVTLVSSFGADAATVKNVEASLRGNASANVQNSPLCTVPKNDLYIGLTDANTNNEVSILQKFLLNNGMSDVRVTGYFGVITKGALDRWQKANGLIIALSGQGTFGPRSRALMATKCAYEVKAEGVAITLLSLTSVNQQSFPVLKFTIAGSINTNTMLSIKNVSSGKTVWREEGPNFGTTTSIDLNTPQDYWGTGDAIAVESGDYVLELIDWPRATTVIAKSATFHVAKGASGI